MKLKFMIIISRNFQINDIFLFKNIILAILFSDRSDKNKDDFIIVTYRYRPSTGNFNKNHCVEQAESS